MEGKGALDKLVGDAEYPGVPKRHRAKGAGGWEVREGESPARGAGNEVPNTCQARPSSYRLTMSSKPALAWHCILAPEGREGRPGLSPRLGTGWACPQGPNVVLRVRQEPQPAGAGQQLPVSSGFCSPASPASPLDPVGSEVCWWQCSVAGYIPGHRRGWGPNRSGRRLQTWERGLIVLTS